MLRNRMTAIALTFLACSACSREPAAPPAPLKNEVATTGQKGFGGFGGQAANTGQQPANFAPNAKFGQPGTNPTPPATTTPPNNTTPPTTTTPPATTTPPDTTAPPEKPKVEKNAPAASSLKVELGAPEQKPTLFFALRSGMEIRITDLKYDKLGFIESYEAAVKTEKGEDKIEVRTEAAAGGGKAPVFKATMGGKAVGALSDKGLLGLSLKDPGGVAIPNLGGTIQIDTKSKLAYDKMGRQQIAAQELTHAGKSYNIRFSDYSRDKLGRLAGYTARVD